MAYASDFRSLAKLLEASPTARMLNLALLARRRECGVRPEAPMFRSEVLDRSLIIKHRLRPGEYDRVCIGRSTVTKILIPLDPADLCAGAACVFVGEVSWREQLGSLAGLHGLADEGDRDLAVLETIDGLPSLDPFLLKEHLRRRGFEVDDSYFAISDADVARMSEFVRGHILPLVTLCLGVAGASPEQTDRLARKLLNSDLDATMEPLRLTLRLPATRFEEGMFCWKGFLYYKWVLDSHVEAARAVARSIFGRGWVGQATLEEKAYLTKAQPRLASAILRSVEEVVRALADYDRAFHQLTDAANPIGFRDFLLDAPGVFAKVGDRLGSLQHIVSFWNYRTRGVGVNRLTAPDLVDLIRDFESSLGCFASSGASIEAAA